MDWGKDLDKHVSERSNEAGQGTEDSNYSEPSNQSDVQPASTASPEDELSQASDNVSVKNRNSADYSASSMEKNFSPSFLGYQDWLLFHLCALKTRKHRFQSDSICSY